MPSAPKTIRLALRCADGVALAAELAMPDGSIRGAAVVCHPHPLHGGTMYNHVVGALFHALAQHGAVTLRFNFRGTSGSQGRHGGGIDERLDVLAAVDAVVDAAESRSRGQSRTPPTLLAGYSFGADVALSVNHPAVSGWLAVAPPLATATMGDMVAATDPRSKHIITGERDDFCPPDRVKVLTADWPQTTITELADQDHFMATARAQLAQLAGQTLDRLIGRSSGSAMLDRSDGEAGPD